MAFNHYQLEALQTVARLKNITSAAVELGLTQPALTRRIQGLETEVGEALFLRKAAGLELTEAGAKVLRFAESVRHMEKALQEELASEKANEPAGLVRIAGYTSILHTVITPAMAPLMRKYDNVQVLYRAAQEVYSYDKLGDLLKKSECDYLVAIQNYEDRDLASHKLGSLELVAIESKKHRTRRHTYLDTRPGDRTTDFFLKAQPGKTEKYERSFVHDEDGILSAVSEGYGRAVIFNSYARKDNRVRLIRDMKPVQWPIYFHYRRQPYYPALAREVIDTILSNSARHLDG